LIVANHTLLGKALDYWGPGTYISDAPDFWGIGLSLCRSINEHLGSLREKRTALPTSASPSEQR